MSNLININNIISNLNIADNKQALQLSEISSELEQAIQTHKSGMLEVLAKSDGFEFILQLGDKDFLINLRNKIKLPLELGQKVEIPVKINSKGLIFPESPIIKEQKDLTKSEVIIQTKENITSRPTLAPIKLQNFVEEYINFVKKHISLVDEHNNFVDQQVKDVSFDNNIKQQILQIVKDIDVSLTKIGSLPSTEADVKNLQNIIKAIVSNPQKIDVLKPQIEQIINNFVGKQLGGEIINKINQFYIVKTSLGETCFSSDIKLPLSEKVTLEIKAQLPVLEQKVKIIDEFLKNILPEHKSLPDIENLSKETYARSFIEMVKNIDKQTLMVIAPKLPLKTDSLFENIYNLYKGIINKDITQWLGSENIKEIIADNVNGEKNITEIGKMLQNSLKETASWKIVEMPFYDGSQLSSIKIATKKDKLQKDKNKDKKVTRFVVDTEFSKLGRFQFDGFSKVEARSLDLIIRTSEKISDDFCANIINLFKKSLYNLDYSGTIKINKDESFINFNDENTIIEGVYI